MISLNITDYAASKKNRKLEDKEVGGSSESQREMPSQHQEAGSRRERKEEDAKPRKDFIKRNIEVSACACVVVVDKRVYVTHGSWQIL